MQREEIAPNYVTMLGLISACTNLSSISHGRVVHGYVLKYGLISELSIGNCLVNMYSKCGSLTDSHRSFKELSTRDSISWGALVNAYALHGCGKEALNLFHEMQTSGIEADCITYLAVLSACNHGGLVEEGQALFNEAVKVDNKSLGAKHYACLIDLLGRAGKLEDACDVIKAMPMKPSIRIWSSLLSACKRHGKLGVAEMLAQQLLLSEPENAALHTLLSMVYAESGNWPGVEQVRNNMKIRGLRKSYGFSRIEVENELMYSNL
ncbi:Pentatricopeptide repeat-containing protein [Heracleum sosnowskyi]|nr:Pentatricopeptide repeat-containing protein [Heracleum sosnowskyi]